jgi:hypothetical protein
MRGGGFPALLASVQSAGEDYEWYPTTSAMVAAVARHLDKSHPDTTIMDIGAGDGRVLAQLATYFEKVNEHGNPIYHKPTLYAIEKSTVLIQAQPPGVIPVGTDLFEQNLATLPVTYIFCNPPYSQFESWASLIIEAGHARKAFLVLPRRWKDNPVIAASIKWRGANVRVIHSDDFLSADRKARAVVDILEVSYPLKDDGYSREMVDPFDSWFDQNISTFDDEDQSTADKMEHELREEALAKIRHLNSIGELVEAYQEEHRRMEENYKAIFKLDYALLKELGVNKETVREGIKVKMAGLKSRYWTILFERLDVIANRLTTATRAKFLEKLTGRAALAFTSSNAYAVVIWAIKNANAYMSQQTVELYKALSTYDNVLRYKSNIRTWVKENWRYLRDDAKAPTHYALDYRIVIERFHAIGTGGWQYDHPQNLYRDCHALIADVIAVLYNLGFPTQSPGSMDPERGIWIAGEWQDWHQLDNSTILFQCKAHKNGNLHFRFLPAAIRAINVEAGRLLGWLKSAEEVVEELGYSKEEAERLFNSTRLIGTGTARLLLGAGTESTNEEK